jgi:hypothetical protein
MGIVRVESNFLPALVQAIAKGMEVLGGVCFLEDFAYAL